MSDGEWESEGEGGVKSGVFGGETSAQIVMEGVSYLTSIPEMKELIVHHAALISLMIKYLIGYDITGSFPPLPPSSSSTPKVGLGTISDFGFVGTIFNLTFDPDLALSGEERERAKQIEMIHEKAGTKEKRIHDLDQTPVVNQRMQILLDLNIGRALSHIGKSVSKLSESLQEMLAGCYLHLSRITEKRGALTADGAIRVLVHLGGGGRDEKDGSLSFRCRQWASQALARLLITTNPHLALRNGLEYDVIAPLFFLLSTDDSLSHYESLLALTNLASMGGDVANAVAGGKRLGIIESFQHMNFVPLRRAATELLCNLSITERYSSYIDFWNRC